MPVQGVCGDLPFGAEFSAVKRLAPISLGGTCCRSGDPDVRSLPPRPWTHDVGANDPFVGDSGTPKR